MKCLYLKKTRGNGINESFNVISEDQVANSIFGLLETAKADEWSEAVENEALYA